MKKNYVLTVALVLFTTILFSQNKLKLIPQPVMFIEGKGNFIVNEFTSFSAEGAAVSTGDWLRSFLQKKTGYRMGNFKKGNTTNCIVLSINKDLDRQIGKEGYRLSVKPNGVKITANTAAGLLNGVQTFLQLFPADIEAVQWVAKKGWNVPVVNITDYPRFAWRGLLLDVSRHFFTMEEVKKMVDEMVRYKFNILQLHLTDDQGWRIEIKSYPALTSKGAWRVPRTGLWWDRERAKPGEAASYGGFYTQQQLKELVQYCSVRNIEVMPEIDVPGHSLAAAAAYPFLSCTKAAFDVNAGNRFDKTDANVFCAGNDSSYQFLEKIFAEVASIFPFEYIHIGGDECNKSFWSKCPVCQAKMKAQGIKNENELQSYFVKRVEKMVESNGKKLMGWDEILEGGLAPNASVMSWRGMKGGIEAAKQNHTVVMTPTDYCYLDLYQGDPAIEPPTYSMLRLKKVYEFDPIPTDVKEQLILGGQGNLWSESVPQFRQAEYMLWPRSLALAEVLWSPKSSLNWKGFVERTEAHLVRLSQADINFSKSIYDAIITPLKDEKGTLLIQLDTELDGLKIYYTFDNTYPDHHSLLYKNGEKLTVPKDAESFGVITYRAGKPIGRIISVSLEALAKRVGDE